MDAVKSTLNKILHHHSSATDHSSTETAPSAATSNPHKDSTAQEDRFLSEATKDLSLNDNKSDATTGDKTTTNALEHRKQNDDNEQTGSTSGATTAPPPVGDVHSFSGSAAKESSEIPNVEDEVQEVTAEADGKAVAAHTRLLNEVEEKVKEVPAEQSGGAIPTSENKAFASTGIIGVGGSSGVDTPVRNIEREVHDAAPDADPRAMQTHSLLVSEVEAVVGGGGAEQGKPVHDIVKGVQRVETPSELNTSSIPVDPTPTIERKEDALVGAAVTPSHQQTANPFESRAAGETPVLQVMSVEDALVVEPVHGELSPAELEKSLRGRA